jgi:hypothetical protein
VNTVHPDLVADWKVAKRASAALAAASGAVILQGPKGEKRVKLHGQIREFPTWLAVWSWLYSIRVDQLGIGRK